MSHKQNPHMIPHMKHPKLHDHIGAPETWTKLLKSSKNMTYMIDRRMWRNGSRTDRNAETHWCETTECYAGTKKCSPGHEHKSLVHMAQALGLVSSAQSTACVIGGARKKHNHNATKKNTKFSQPSPVDLKKKAPGHNTHTDYNPCALTTTRHAHRVHTSHTLRTNYDVLQVGRTVPENLVPEFGHDVPEFLGARISSPQDVPEFFWSKTCCARIWTCCARIFSTIIAEECVHFAAHATPLEVLNVLCPNLDMVCPIFF